MSFGEKLKYYREKKGLSQPALGCLLDNPVSAKTISSWEVNWTEPQLEVVLNISKILNVTLDDLINDDIISNSPTFFAAYNGSSDPKKNELIKLLLNNNIPDDKLSIIKSVIESYIQK